MNSAKGNSISNTNKIITQKYVNCKNGKMQKSLEIDTKKISHGTSSVKQQAQASTQDRRSVHHKQKTVNPHSNQQLTQQQMKTITWLQENNEHEYTHKE